MYRRQHIRRYLRRSNLDTFLEKFELRSFRIMMLAVFLIFMADKVWHTAVNSEFVTFLFKPQQHVQAAAPVIHAKIDSP